MRKKKDYFPVLTTTFDIRFPLRFNFEKHVFHEYLDIKKKISS